MTTIMMRNRWLVHHHVLPLLLAIVIVLACGFSPPYSNTAITPPSLPRNFRRSPDTLLLIRDGSTSGTTANEEESSSIVEQQQEEEEEEELDFDNKDDDDDDQNKFYYEIATKLRTSIYNHKNGYDSRDPKYGIESFRIDIPIQPSLGLELIEVAHSTADPNCGLVLISGVTGNAAKATTAAATGDGNNNNYKIQKGDTIVGVSSCGGGGGGDGESSSKHQHSTTITSTTGLDYDSTMDAIIQAKTNAELLNHDSINVQINRLVPRAPVEVIIVSPEQEEKETPIDVVLHGLAGDNLRLLLKQNKIYHCSNDCGGEGICGSDMIEVLEGSDDFVDYLGPSTTRRRRRKACQTIVGRNNQQCSIKIRCLFSW